MILAVCNLFAVFDGLLCATFCSVSSHELGALFLGFNDGHILSYQYLFVCFMNDRLTYLFLRSSAVCHKKGQLLQHH